jgi:hypothetical protein
MKRGEIPKQTVKYHIHVKTNQRKMVNSRGTKEIAEKEKLKDQRAKGYFEVKDNNTQEIS